MFTGDTQIETDKKDAPLTREDVERLLREAGGPDRLNLSGRNLEAIQLASFNLMGTNLSEANLSGANLSGSDLYRCDLSRADLSEANLYAADLSWANLNKAQLFGANLSMANLSEANLSEAILYRADLSGAYLYGTYLGGANISEFEKEQLLGRGATGLDEIKDEKGENISIFRIRIIEEPLTTYNLFMIISVFTELHTKCWLIQKNRFSELIEYAQTRDSRFIRAANLSVVKMRYNSPALLDFLVGSASIAGTATLALALKTAIDAVTQAQLRFQATKLENQKKELEMKIQEQEAQQAQQIAAQKAEMERKAEEQAQQIAAQKAEMERQKMLLELTQQQLELEQQQLELERQRLEVERNRIEVALEAASKMVDILNPGTDVATKGMLVQPLLTSLLQLGTTKGLELDLPASQRSGRKESGGENA